MKTFITVLSLFFAIFSTNPALAASVEDFYKGRDVKLIIGGGLGGTYGLYAQLAAKHIKKHIPGNPTVIVQTMAGGGGLKALNYMYNAAPRDGSVLAILHSEVLFETLLNEKVRFNAQEYNWLGRFVDVVYVGIVSKQSGIRSLEDAKGREVVSGATGLRSVTALGPALFNRFAGTKFKIIGGYKGTRRIFQALAQGEVDAVCSSWVNLRVVHGSKIDSGEYVPIFAVGMERLPALPNIPTITEFGRTKADNLFLELYSTDGMIGRSLGAPPGVPQDRVIALRAAYDKTIKDPEFLAEVKARKIMINPMPGQKLAANIDKYMKTPPEEIAAARKVHKDLLADIKK